MSAITSCPHGYRVSIAAYVDVLKPRSYTEANTDPNWIDFMKAEIEALEDNHTWTIVDLPG